MQKLQKQTFIYCKPLVECYLKSVEDRFYHFYNFKNPQSEFAAIASLSHPRFKNKWFSCIEPSQQTKIKNWFKAAVLKVLNNVDADNTTQMEESK